MGIFGGRKKGRILVFSSSGDGDNDRVVEARTSHHGYEPENLPDYNCVYDDHFFAFRAIYNEGM